METKQVKIKGVFRGRKNMSKRKVESVGRVNYAMVQKQIMKFTDIHFNKERYCSTPALCLFRQQTNDNM